MSQQKMKPCSKSTSPPWATHASPLSHPRTRDSKNTSAPTLHQYGISESFLQVPTRCANVTWRRTVKSMSHS